MNYIKINGRSFDVDVAISNIEESFSVLDGDNVGRVLSGRMVRDIIGTYIGHKVTFFNGKSQSDFDALWDYLIAHSVDDSVQLEAAYYTSGSRKLKEGMAADGVNRWDEISVNFIPMDAQVRP